MNDLEINKIKKFSLLLLVLSIFLTLSSNVDEKLKIFIAFSTIFGIIVAYFCPFLLKKLYFVWINAGNLMGFITTLIILSFIFFLLIVPLKFLRGKKNNLIKINFKKKQSYWEEANNKHLSLQDLMRQF